MLTRLSILNFLQVSVRNMASAYTFQDMKTATTNKNIYLIDVREPNELKETGVIPGSVNIPVGRVESFFSKYSDEQFKEAVGKDKPDFNTEIVVSCRSGRRSELVKKILEGFGYCNVHNYEGGWLDWEKNLSNQNK